VGALGEAAALFEKVLAADPAHPVALHLLGVVSTQQGEPRRAIELIGRALVLRPNGAAMHVNMGEAYRQLGELLRAAGCCRTALRLRPDFPEALNTLGLVRREQGRLDQALDLFRRAVELAPDSVPPRTNLSLVLMDLGRAEESLAFCEEAVGRQPDVALLHHNVGNVLRVLDRMLEARASYLEALRLDPELALTHLHLGLTLRREGRFHEALAWYRQTIDLDGRNPFFWEQLAELHGDREEPGEAAACWRRALELAPVERPGPHVGLGWALQDEGRLDEAVAQYQAATQLQPDFAPALLHLGGAHEERGELAEAEAAFRAALRAQPEYPLPHARLATLLRGELPEADRAALEARLADPALAPGPRARLLFARAHVLDALGEYPGAAESLRQANALARELARGQREYSPADHERYAEALRRQFDAAFFARVAGAGLETRRPVFVFGLPRSGTTLIEQVLASHPQVHGAGELRLGRQTFDAIPEAVGAAELPPEAAARLDAAAIRRLAERHLEQLGTRDGGRAERVADKMPDNYLYLGLLAAMFPRALFIHCRRDLRDIAVSCWMTDFRSIRWANDPAHIAAHFREYRRLMDHWRTVLPVPVVHVDYEETVADLEGVARRLLDACGLPWDPACLEFHRTRRSVRTASVTQVRQPIYTKSVARWKHYEHLLAELFQSLPVEEPRPLEIPFEQPCIQPCFS
jgi:tetratricopeptide (TPR) repeat protein